jgi:putative N6-adenine-specific DNA methylase
MGQRDNMNLDRQIKRHIIGPRHTFFAITLPDFETICSKELALLSDTLTVEKEERGGVSFSGRLTDLYRANLHSRTAGRILLRIGTFKATNFHQLVQRTGAINWALYLPSGAMPACKVTARHSRLYHSQAVAQRIGQGIAAHWRSMGVTPGQAMGQTLLVRLDNDQLTLSLDSSGDNLYRRGLKRHGAQAPLRETTAAIILQLAGFEPGMPLVDPMCGAGTFSLEAALMTKQVAPGLHRAFAFMQWPAFKPRQWHHLTKIAAQKIQTPPRPLIWASDIESQACANLNQCIEDNGLKESIHVFQKDFFSLTPEAFSGGPGLIVINPPFGRRLAPANGADNLQAFMRDIVDKLLLDFSGWRVALLAPPESLSDPLSLSLKGRALVHGGLTLTLLTGKLG